MRGTDIICSTRPECEGLEVTGRNQTSAEARGVHLHATLALSGEGLPLGVLRCAYKRKANEKKTHTWIDGPRDMGKAAETLPRAVCNGPGSGLLFGAADTGPGHAQGDNAAYGYGLAGYAPDIIGVPAWSRR